MSGTTSLRGACPTVINPTLVMSAPPADCVLPDVSGPMFWMMRASAAAQPARTRAPVAKRTSPSSTACSSSPASDFKM